MDTHNLNLPPDWKFPQFTTNRGETNDLEHLCSTLQDLSLYGFGSDYFHQAFFLPHFLSSGAGGGWLGRGDKVR